MSLMRTNITILTVVLVLASCKGFGQNGVSTQEPGGNPFIETPTPTPTPWAIQTNRTEIDEFPTYKNDFESITDPAAAGITSNGNGMDTKSISGIQINEEIVKSGSQSLEVSGTIGSQANSFMTIDLPVKTLIGRDRIDLSNKTLSVSVFIPQGSPFEKVYFACSSSGKPAMITANVAGEREVEGRWFSDDVSIQRALENRTTWVFSGLDRETAKNIFRNCETISIVGVRWSEGESSPAGFIIDDLKWANANSVSIDEQVDSLRKYAPQHLKVGSVLFNNELIDYTLDPKYVQTLAQEFNLVYGIASNWPKVDPGDASQLYIDESYNDVIFNLATAAKLSRKGFTGGDPVQNPDWIRYKDFDELQPYLESRIGQDVSRYKGGIYLWDVWNEVVNSYGTGLRDNQGVGYENSPWVDASSATPDTSLIEAGFVKAHQTDLNAKLFINDYEVEFIGKDKAKAFYSLVSDMKSKGVPIDGVGFQLHVCVTKDGTVRSYGASDNEASIDNFLKNVDNSVKKFAELGLLVEFSEIEVGIKIDDINFSSAADQETYKKRLAAQAKVYGGLAEIAVENNNVTAFIVWMVSDRYNQGIYPGYGDTSLFDAEYKPKPAYYAVLDVFKER
jgi:GH35 family endo-1,4-beta-xylanase